MKWNDNLVLVFLYLHPQLFILNYLWVYTYEYKCSQRPELELGVIMSFLLWVLGTELSSSGREAYTVFSPQRTSYTKYFVNHVCFLF